MKNRILGITAILAVVVLGVAFIVSCGPGEDTEITFENKTGVDLTVMTDGNPASLRLDKATNKLGPFPKGTVTKAGSNITFTRIVPTSATEVNPDTHIDIDTSGLSEEKDGKDGKKIWGSGNVTFTPKAGDWGAQGNPAAIPNKISVISVIEP